MDSDLKLRISAAVLICFSCNLLLIGTTYANRSKNGYTEVTQQATGFQLSSMARRYGVSIQIRELGFERELSAGTGSAVVERDGRPAVADSTFHGKAPSDCNQKGERAANLMCTRRALRDISPPGMWPPGPPAESLPWISRRRALLTVTGDSSDGVTRIRMRSSVRPASVVQSSDF